MIPLLALTLAALVPQEQQPAPGTAAPPQWRCWLESPGGPLPFGLDLLTEESKTTAVVHNDPERITLEVEHWDGERLRLRLDPYDSWIEATVDGDGMTGTWTKRRGKNKTTAMAFSAARGGAFRFLPERAEAVQAGTFAGRWRVQFANDQHPAVAVFEERSGSGMRGTFRTALGDYRFLAGDRAGATLRLSCFDGAHAFLFTARLQADGTLRGDFWSADTWHEIWTAVKDPAAAMPDPFALTEVRPGATLAGLAYPDLDGAEVALDGDGLRGQARILQVFGSWCPNCNDASRFLADLHRRHRDRGLRVVGLAFEFPAEREEQVARVRRYKERNRVGYPTLLAGPADKKAASAAFPLLDRIRSYPTTIFVDRRGTVRAVHQGFDGPATGAAHQRLQERFEALVEELLAAPRDG